jgi:DNA-binding winged helix-turn-helix (wHTH) protein/TolB-like protein
MFMDSSTHPNKSGPSRVNIGPFTLDTGTGELWRGTERLKLQRQPAMVLCLLVARAGQVVSREEIRRAIWEPDTHVDYEQGINWCIRQLRKVLADDAIDPQYIETVAKQGYRFVAPCVDLSVATHTQPTRRAFWLPAVAFALILLTLIAVLRGHRVEERPPTLLVLPLDNFSGDSHIDVLADAATDDLISAIGASPHRLRVIDRLTSAKFKRSNECIIKIGRALHADYVFIGSITPSNSSLRVSGGVFRVSDNTQIWTTGLNGPVLGGSDAVKNLSDAIANTVLHVWDGSA